ncbi:N5-carboxyaminoimidazole ribonucleotide mutase [Anatilimnocola aggregata]|uniref:N5-carboxyaminoimidazole ribonucleotide mutase n=1 Tax=Anatilimnocola aggregata TaxID=2528021 RepID=A0A517YAV3_9BACT|nr:nickel pincer cofactor biosynthesis protein LarB [Anatilimnocola aggregata]QDU27363.1 N5-carboxyaminoimidazole ribonucleotide mutase [Anatilimnocola aggregata]
MPPPLPSPMPPDELAQLTADLLAGKLPREDFLSAISAAMSANTTAVTPDVTLDLDRARRCGFPEVIFGEGKPAATIATIFDRLLAAQVRCLATRISEEKADLLRAHFASRKNPTARYNSLASTFRVDPHDAPPLERKGRVTVITAGTSDLAVADEARETLDWMGINVHTINDVGVAGPHRLPARLPEFVGSDAIVCVAGMEAALPSIVGGYVDCPVIGVPTSVGYGANFGGIAALLSMLNSCAANVTVVNINAGFKGGYLAGMIASKLHDARQRPQ